MVKKFGLVLGVGVDILKTSRFQRLIENKHATYITRLSTRILHPKYELPTFDKFLKEGNVNKCTLIISGSWSTKEALYKTLDTEHQLAFQFNQWYRYYNDRGKPYIGNEKYFDIIKDEEFLLSISHDDDIMIANVIRQKLVDL